MKIGNQTWMAENLAYKPSSGNYWAYDNDNTNVAKYGYLYNWETAKNVCPSSWHLPSDADWKVLTLHLGGKEVAGTKMKSISGWTSGGNGTNISGFNGFPAGALYINGYFANIGDMGLWWSSSRDVIIKLDFSIETTDKAKSRQLLYSSGSVYNVKSKKTYGYSVRCIKD